MTSGLMVGPTVTAGSGEFGGSVLGLALIAVGAFDGCWVQWLLGARAVEGAVFTRSQLTGEAVGAIFVCLYTGATPTRARSVTSAT